MHVVLQELGEGLGVEVLLVVDGHVRLHSHMGKPVKAQPLQAGTARQQVLLVVQQPCYACEPGRAACSA